MADYSCSFKMILQDIIQLLQLLSLRVVTLLPLIHKATPHPLRIHILKATPHLPQLPTPKATPHHLLLTPKPDIIHLSLRIHPIR